MNTERYQFLNLTNLPGRLNLNETAWYLGFSPHDIPILVGHKLLKPLGNPPPNGGRYFSSSELQALRHDTKWLDKASAVLIKYWKNKNARRSNEARPNITLTSEDTLRR
jgi:hypothetical protein